jgi:pimeloyl-ACP methyl ester carboxylesterase
LVWGEHDVTCTPEHLMERLVQGWSNRSGAIVKDAGHWVQYEQANEINQLLIDWFR